MRPFAWVLLALPVFLLVRGRLVDYLKLTTEQNEAET